MVPVKVCQYQSCRDMYWSMTCIFKHFLIISIDLWTLIVNYLILSLLLCIKWYDVCRPILELVKKKWLWSIKEVTLEVNLTIFVSLEDFGSIICLLVCLYVSLFGLYFAYCLGGIIWKKLLDVLEAKFNWLISVFHLFFFIIYNAIESKPLFDTQIEIIVLIVVPLFAKQIDVSNHD